MKKCLSIFIVLFLILSCNNDNDSGQDDRPVESESISFKTKINAPTRVASGVFEHNDAINVYAFDGESEYASSVDYVYDGYVFKSDAPIEYQTAEQQLTFAATYPAVSDASVFDFTISIDQSVDGAYDMSDLLVSKTAPVHEKTPELLFYHRMCNVVINVISTEPFSGGSLVFNAKNVAACNLKDLTYESKGELTDMTAALNGETGFKAIIAPQTITANDLFATLTVGERTYNWSPLSDLEFLSGKQYVYNWNIETNEVSFSGIINDWGENENGNSGSDIAYTRLKDYSETAFPTDTDEWIIYDKYVSTSDLAGLRAALNSVGIQGREVSVGFVNLLSVPEKAFYESGKSMKALTRVSLPFAINIGANAFMNCSSLKSIATPNVEIINSEAFKGCSLITTLNTGKLISIGSEAFSRCVGIKTLAIDNIKNISNNAFRGMSQLQEIYLPKVENIGNAAFYNLANLIYIDAPLVLTIEPSAFYGCSNLSSISFPLVKLIERSAFYQCTALHTINIPMVETIETNAFQYCKLIQKVDLPNLKYMGSDCFAYCESIESVNLPNALTVAGFRDCILITEVNLPEVTTIASGAFASCSLLKNVTAPKVTAIGSSAFSDCISLTSVDFPKLRSIGGSGFSGCKALNSVSMPELISMSGYVFNSCTSLKSISLPKLFTAVDGGHFQGCSILTDVNLPKVVEMSGYYNAGSFEKCVSLKTIYLPEVLTIGACFKGCISLIDVNLPKLISMNEYGDDAFGSCQALESIELALLTEVLGSLFNNCTSLHSVSLPNVTSIQYSSFNNCPALTNVSLPNVEKIYGFNNCNSMKTISLPNVKTIAGGAFQNCSELTTVELPKLETLENDCFENCLKLSSFTISTESKLLAFGTGAFNNLPSLEGVTLTIGKDNALRVNTTTKMFLAPKSSGALAETYGPFKSIILQ